MSLHNSNWKLFLAIIAALFDFAAFMPYFLDIFRRRTHPHIYTWLTWTLTQGTAALALLFGGGGFGGVELVAATVLVFVIFLLSFRYGTKNITKGDTALLVVTLVAIVVWWQAHQPLLAVILVSAIDALGYIPTWRKTYAEPWSETLWSWVFFAIACILAILALNQFNAITMTYLITVTLANSVVVAICLYRRPGIARPH